MLGDYSRYPKNRGVVHLKSKLLERALTPLFGNGAGALGIGKISGVSTKIGKIYIVYMYVVSIARFIQIVNLSLFLEIIYKISFNN